MHAKIQKVNHIRAIRNDTPALAPFLMYLLASVDSLHPSVNQSYTYAHHHIGGPNLFTLCWRGREGKSISRGVVGLVMGIHF